MDNHQLQTEPQWSPVNSTTNKEKYRRLCLEETTIPIFSRDWWLDIVCGENNWDVFLLEENNRIIATFPFYSPVKRVITMPPYTQTMGPWFARESQEIRYSSRLGKRQKLCESFLHELQSYTHFLQNFHYNITDWLPFYWKNFSQSTRYTYLLTEIQNRDALWQGMNQNIQRNIQKAKNKYSLTVRQHISVDAFIEVYKETLKRQHLSIQHEKTLRELIEACRKKGQGEIWGSYTPTGELVAAVFIIWQPSSAYYLAGGANETGRTTGGLHLALWESIQQVSSYTSLFDLEGSMLQGVERFFREFGGKQTPYFTITKGNWSLLYRAWMKFRRLL